MSELAALYSGHVLEKAKKDKTTVERSEISVANVITADSFKRSQLLQGRATERHEVVNGAEILLQIQSGKIRKEDAYEVLKQSKE